MDPVASGLAGVRERIGTACARAGRDPAGVLLVAVSKTADQAAIRRAVAAGVPALGESRVQEARLKIESLGRPVPWHLIGHLQTNKAHLAVRLFDTIHSVDSERLARALGEEAGRAGVDVDALVQVDLTGQAARSGCRPAELAPLAEVLLEQPRLHLRGLMTIPPFDPDPERSRPFFRALRELRDATAPALRPGTLDELSMGMSGDLEIAIEEGATMVRVGTAIFGERS